MIIRQATIEDAKAISGLILPLVEKFIAPEFSPLGQRNLLTSMEQAAIRGFFEAGPPETKDEVTAVPMKYEPRCDRMLAARPTVDEIRPCTESDFKAIYTIINDAAQAYQGVIPERQMETSVVLREVGTGE